MTKATHPADAANAAVIQNAKFYAVSLFLGAGTYLKDTAPTMDEAITKGQTMRAMHPTCGRVPMIYAVNDKGQQAPITTDAFKTLSQEPTIMTKKPASKTAAAKPASKTAKGGKPAAKAKAAPKADEAPKAAPKAAAARKARLEKLVEVSAKAAPKAPAAKPAAAPKPAANADKPLGKRAQILADAQAGKMPTPPDFSAETHARFRGKLDEVVKLAKAGDIKGLKAYKINPISSSPKAIAKFRDLAVIALEARAAKKAAA